MKVFRSLEDYIPGSKTVATIGTFDGLHIGHKTILRQIIQTARDRQGESLLISFHPHPRLVLFPENNPLRLLQTLDEKIEMLDDLGLDKLLLIPFTREFSRLKSKAFIRDILIQTVQMDHIIIGYDHRFGKNRTGGIEELEELKEEGKYTVEEIPAQAIDDAYVSSTKIRKALEACDVQQAARFLGYPYSFAGPVVHGEKQGRLLGYPTANIEPEDRYKLIPADGVYFVRVRIGDEAFYGMMSIGKKPTMGEFARSHEVYIFDFDRQIYGQTIRVEMLNFIRHELKFNSLDELMAAMAKDQAFCMARIAELEAAE